MFDNRYDIVLADTENSKSIHYKLRYQVYCLEKGFEKAEKFRDGLEKDDHDHSAIQFLIKCNQTNNWIGTFRLVIGSIDTLPISQHLLGNGSKSAYRSARVAEFSRLAVLRQFQVPSAGIKEEEAESSIIFRVMSAGIEYCRTNGINDAVFLCRRSLAHVLNTKGVITTRIGPGISHKGIRYPYSFDLRQFPRRLLNNEITRKNYEKNSNYYCFSHVLNSNQKAA